MPVLEFSSPLVVRAMLARLPCSRCETADVSLSLAACFERAMSSVCSGTLNDVSDGVASRRLHKTRIVPRKIAAISA